MTTTTTADEPVVAATQDKSDDDGLKDAPPVPPVADDETKEGEAVAAPMETDDNAANETTAASVPNDVQEETDVPPEPAVQVRVVDNSMDEKENTAERPEEEQEPTPTSKGRAAEKEATNTNPTETEQQEQPAVDIARPVKRARTAYFIFADEKRSQIQTETTGAPAMAKALGQLWATISDEEKLAYQQKAATERATVAAALAAWKAAGGVVPDSSHHGGAHHHHSEADALVFPMNRIRKICKLDPEVRNLSKEALLLVTKAAELALVKVAKETVQTASIQNRRKLLPEDLVQVCSVRDQFQFLREDIQDLHRKQQAENSNKKKDATAAASTTKGDTMGAKPLTDYFAVKK